jgi:enamine deaminase RidA (YjgF/YER057c/UK114 family)
MGWGEGAIARGTFVFLSGTTGRDPATDLVPASMGEQTLMCWERISESLQKAGTSCANIVQRITYVTDMDEWFSHAAGFQRRWLAQNCPELLEHEPGSALIGVQRLALAAMKVEIMVIAVIPDCAPRRSACRGSATRIH